MLDGKNHSNRFALGPNSMTGPAIPLLRINRTTIRTTFRVICWIGPTSSGIEPRDRDDSLSTTNTPAPANIAHGLPPVLLSSTVSEIIGANDNIKGNREAAAPRIERSGYAVWLWNVGYAVGRELFAPRGRKWGGIGSARSPRWPTWAEGEKRLLSAIKKP